MHDADPQAINALTNPEAGFETRDMKIAGLWKHIVGFFIYTILMIGFVILLYDVFIPMIFQDGGQLRGRTTAAMVPAAPNPKLQNGHETMMDIVELKKKEKEQSESYAWVDKERGIAKVPIEKAMDLVAKSRLQVTFSPPKPPETRQPTAPASGPPMPSPMGGPGGGQ